MSIEYIGHANYVACCGSLATTIVNFIVDLSEWLGVGSLKDNVKLFISLQILSKRFWTNTDSIYQKRRGIVDMITSAKDQEILSIMSQTS